MILMLLNGHHSELMNRVMWTVSDRWTWAPLYVVLLAIIVLRYGWKKSLLILLCIAITIALTDQLCASVIRPAVGRLRPSHPDNPISPLITLVNGYHGGKYGFPSCHAANSAALTAFVACLFRSWKLTVAMIVWTLAISYSRAYLGVHYPTDLLGGWLAGSLIGYGMWRLYRKISTIYRL